MPLTTPCIGAYPKPDYVPITDWFQVGHDAEDYNDQVLRNWSEDPEIQSALDRATAEVIADQNLPILGLLGIRVPCITLSIRPRSSGSLASCW